MAQIPVVLFVYRKTEILSRVLECLRADGVPLLHVFSDGARSADEADEVSAVRGLVRSIDWCECHVEESPVNLGLGVSVKRGVGSVLQRYGSAIVFEDDLVCVPGTYRYLAAALRHYAEDAAVMSVTGWTHPGLVPEGVGGKPYFDGKAECWAWGTWARAWDGMDEPAMEIMEACRREGLDIERYGTDMPKMAREAQTRNLWAIGWWYHHMRRHGLCLRPPWSLVEHICWDQNLSTTSTPAMMAWANPPLGACPPIPEDWPEPVEDSQCAPRWRKMIDG